MNSSGFSKLATINFNNIFPNQLPNLKAVKDRLKDPMNSFCSKNKFNPSIKLKNRFKKHFAIKKKNIKNHATICEQTITNDVKSPKANNTNQGIQPREIRIYSPKKQSRFLSPQAKNYCVITPFSSRRENSEISNIATIKSPNLNPSCPLGKLFNKLKEKYKGRRNLSPNNFGACCLTKGPKEEKTKKERNSRYEDVQDHTLK